MFIVNYHNVLDHDLDAFDRRSLRIPVDEFREEMRCLRDQMNPVPLEMLVRMAQEGRTDPRAVAVTFDDGYLGVLHHAFPIMQEFGIVSTVFIITDSLREGPRTLRHYDELEMAFRITRVQALELAAFGYPERDLTGEADRMSCLLDVKRVLKTLKESYRRRSHRMILERLEVTPEQCCRAATDEKYRMLDAGHLRRLIEAGWTIGSHSCSHRTLRCLDDAELRAEITGSREELTRVLGIETTCFAYPYGGSQHIGEKAPRLVAESGYGYALTALPGRVGPDTDWFHVPRVSWEELIALV